MMIDVHSLCAPPELDANGMMLVGSDGNYTGMEPKIDDDRFREHLQVLFKALDLVGTDFQMVSPRPFTMLHSRGPRLVEMWTRWTNNAVAQQVVCVEKIGPILKRAREGMGMGEFYGTSAIYAGADRCEAA